MIIAAPGMKPGYAETFAEFTDVYPTLCDLSGIQIPSNLDGKSLVLALKDKQSKVHEYAISQYPRKLTAREVKEKGYRSNEIMGYSLRTERYRYTIWLNDFTTNKEFKEKYTYTEELYDYEKDPLETKNVIEQQEYLTTKTQLKQQMIRFFKEQKNR